MFFVANDIAEAKQVSTFLSAVGKKAYAVLKDLLSPDKPLALCICVLSLCELYLVCPCRSHEPVRRR